LSHLKRLDKASSAYLRPRKRREFGNINGFFQARLVGFLG